MDSLEVSAAVSLGVLVLAILLGAYVAFKPKKKPKLKLVKQEPPPPFVGLLAQIEKDMYGKKPKSKKAKPKLVAVKKRKVSRGKRK